MNEQFWFGIGLALIICIFFLVWAILGVLYLDYQREHLQPICSAKTGAAMWVYDGNYARDLTRQEKQQFCPRWTLTPAPATSTPYGPGTNP